MLAICRQNDIVKATSLSKIGVCATLPVQINMSLPQKERLRVGVYDSLLVFVKEDL